MEIGIFLIKFYATYFDWYFYITGFHLFINPLLYIIVMYYVHLLGLFCFLLSICKLMCYFHRMMYIKVLVLFVFVLSGGCYVVFIYLSQYKPLLLIGKSSQ